MIPGTLIPRDRLAVSSSRALCKAGSCTSCLVSRLCHPSSLEMVSQPSQVPNKRSHSCWLLKAEPESRLEKGHDVKFSVDDFEKVKITAWEGVRNHQAKNFLKERMRVGDRALFYASSCKVPGVTAFAKVVRNGYPDHNAWDPDHPYYDPKSDSENPTWFMVDLEFVSRLPHMVSLAFLQHIASLSELPDALNYLSRSHFDAIKSMTLLNRGRLSVQPVDDLAYEAVELLGTRGGFDHLLPAKKSKRKPEQQAATNASTTVAEVQEESPKKKATKVLARPKKVPVKVMKEKTSNDQRINTNGISSERKLWERRKK